MGARLSVKSELPILVLENMERSIKSIHCSESMIKLSFTSPNFFEILEDVLAQVSDFILVTAHDGCNEAGERTPYL